MWLLVERVECADDTAGQVGPATDDRSAADVDDRTGSVTGEIEGLGDDVDHRAGDVERRDRSRP